MIKLYICCLVLIIGSVEVGLDIDMKFHQEVMEIVSYDNIIKGLIHVTISSYRTSTISTCTANSNSSLSTIGYTEGEHCLIDLNFDDGDDVN